MQIKRFVALILIVMIASACTPAELEQRDPVVYVDGATCPDEHGNPQPLIAGFQCCADHGLGPGQCPENGSCMLPDSCTAMPISPNDMGASKPTRRLGL